MGRKKKFQIREIKHSSGSVSYEAFGTVRGKLHRKRFGTWEEVNSFRDAQSIATPYYSLRECPHLGLSSLSLGWIGALNHRCMDAIFRGVTVNKQRSCAASVYRDGVGTAATVDRLDGVILRGLDGQCLIALAEEDFDNLEKKARPRLGCCG